MKPSMPQRRATIPALDHSKDLRDALTDAERALWRILHANQLEGVHFRRQHAIGPFIVDFCAPRRKLVIELDGGQHAEQEEYDRRRTAYLQSRGYRVLRFWNQDVLGNMDGVIIVILEALGLEGKETSGQG